MKNTIKKEILIVDDSATNVFLLESVLNEYGYKAITANSAKEAFKAIEKKHPDLILIDILMPQISGFEFIKTIKRNPLLGSIPIIAVSAITDEESIREVIKAGANLFVNKPIIISDLLDKIKLHLKE
jgi:two-component system sensor histidine kinase/response regulator